MLASRRRSKSSQVNPRATSMQTIVACHAMLSVQHSCVIMSFQEIDGLPRMFLLLCPLKLSFARQKLPRVGYLRVAPDR